MRVGVWNLKLAPRQATPRGAGMLALAGESQADLWLFTEVHTSWYLPGYAHVVSGLRSGGSDQGRWSGIACSDAFDMTALPLPGTSAADEGLCLVRLEPTTGLGPGFLVACSVLPWTNTVAGWPALHKPGQSGRFADRFRYVVDSHAKHIQRVRRRDEVLIWGGDFNESLSGPPVFSHMGREALRETFDELGVTALTTDVPHLIEGISSIDHVSISSAWLKSPRVAVVTRADDPRQSSDHALYLIDVTWRFTELERVALGDA